MWMQQVWPIRFDCSNLSHLNLQCDVKIEPSKRNAVFAKFISLSDHEATNLLLDENLGYKLCKAIFSSIKLCIYNLNYDFMILACYVTWIFNAMFLNQAHAGLVSRNHFRAAKVCVCVLTPRL